MKTHMHALKLETEYAKNGNSTGEQVNTLSIAVGFGDINEIHDNSMEWFDDAEKYALDRWLCLASFDATLSKEDARRYSEDLKAYHEAYEEWCEEVREGAWTRDLPENHGAVLAMNEARDDAYDEMRREWLWGDRSSSGVLGEARKRYGVEFDYDKEVGTVSVEFSDEDIEEAYDYGKIDEKTPEAFAEWLSGCISGDAYSENEKSRKQTEKRREEYARLREYKEEQKRAEEERTRERLRAIAG